MLKLLIGLLKGAVIGGAVGFGAFALKNSSGFGNAWLTYGVVGALVGLLCGKPIWSLVRDKNSTNIIAILKAAFGFGVGCGLYAIIAKAWSPSALMVGGYDVFSWPVSLGAAIGAVYGGFVELDDSVGDPAPKAKTAAATKKKLPASDE
ncbi:MAG: hypothetical protein H0T79_14295 [Deltaproteobacteria bacterium]|nr:hypothetical protein [Deltaproteobacteria bacterium]